DRERGRRADAGADAAVPRAGDRFVQTELATPEVLVAEGLVAEDLPPLLDEPAHVAVDDAIEAAPVDAGSSPVVPCMGRLLADRTEGLDQHEEAGHDADRGQHEPSPRACGRHAAASTRRTPGSEARATAAACASVRRASAKAAIAISTSRTATSK